MRSAELFLPPPALSAAQAGSILQEFSLIWLSLAENFTSLSGVWVCDPIQSGRCFARGLL